MISCNKKLSTIVATTHGAIFQPVCHITPNTTLIIGSRMSFESAQKHVEYLREVVFNFNHSEDKQDRLWMKKSQLCHVSCASLAPNSIVKHKDMINLQKLFLLEERKFIFTHTYSGSGNVFPDSSSVTVFLQVESDFWAKVLYQPVNSKAFFSVIKK